MPPAIRLLLLALAAYWAALLAGVEARLLTQGVYLLLQLTAVGFVAVRAIRRPDERLAWGLLAAGLSLWTLGSVWQVAQDLRGADLPFPSVSDALWLSLYPFAFAALGVLAHARLSRPPGRFALDALMVSLVALAVVAQLVEPAVTSNRGDVSLLGQAVNAAYPAADALLVALSLTAALLAGWRADRTWSLLAAGAVALTAADTLWTVQASDGTWAPVMSSNALYPAFAVLVAASAWTPPADGRWDPRREARVVLGALAAAVVAVGMLTLDIGRDFPHVLLGMALLVGISGTSNVLRRSISAGREAARRQALVDETRRALAAAELELHFQPQVDVRSGDVVGAEALLRWPRPDGGFRAPDEFLPAVERSDLIGPLTDFVIDRALDAAARWRRGGRELGISVNLASANLSDLDLPRRVSDALARHALPASSLVLEVTETAAVIDGDEPDRVMAGLHELGVELSVDDFGTGHSSLARLARFPIDEIKVDRSFVNDLGASEQPIVATTIQLAHALGLRVVAEGIEDAGTLNALRALGCDVAQGYFVARPLAPEDFERWLASRVSGVEARELVESLLRQVAAELGMDAAFITEFVGDEIVVRAFEGTGGFGPLGDGSRGELEESYCHRVVNGVFPNLIADARNDERTRDLPVTEVQRIGAYLGMPLRRPSGELYGTLCCVSAEARPELDEAALAVARRVAERLRPLLADAHLAVGRREAASA